jgi:hypothetical protein
MKDSFKVITRRDFLKGATYAALATSIGLSGEVFGDDALIPKKTRVILVRNKDVIDSQGAIDGKIMGAMLDQAMTALFDREKPSDAWRTIINPDDIVGIKTNVWGPLPTPPSLEQAIKEGVMAAGVEEKNISIDDRGVLNDKVFLNSTALINVRPMRTHHWAGVGSLLKNYIMFVLRPWDYHGNSCADLALLWKLPIVKDKTRLNILVMLTPLFHGVGAHHFDKTYTWAYRGILVGTDPVAVDSVGLRILNAQRKVYFGEEKPIKPPPHHIIFADTKHKLGVSDMRKIELIRLGLQEGALI